jgi:uncharacterized protein YkwD
MDQKKCSISGDRWSRSANHHWAWCLDQRAKGHQFDLSETKIRDDAVAACKPEVVVSEKDKNKEKDKPKLTPEQQAMLDLHNGHRRTCGVPQLTWSKEVADSAQAWANGCHKNLSNPSRFCHQNDSKNCGAFPKNPYGENLHWGASATPQTADRGWYGEYKNYIFQKPVYSDDPVVGHFTQMVWRDTTQLGCAKNNCGGQILWVCRYHKPGNWNVVPGSRFNPPQPRPTEEEAEANLRANVSNQCKP